LQGDEAGKVEKAVLTDADYLRRGLDGARR